MITMRAIRELRPNASFSITGDDLSTLIWITDGVTSPTQEEVNTKIAELEAEDAQAIVNANNAKAAAEAKVSALGLTVDDIKALLQ